MKIGVTPYWVKMTFTVWVSRVCISRCFSEDTYFEGRGASETVSINYRNLLRIARYLFKEIAVTLSGFPCRRSCIFLDHVHQALTCDR
jgi:hypothetical protein